MALYIRPNFTTMMDFIYNVACNETKVQTSDSWIWHVICQPPLPDPEPEPEVFMEIGSPKQVLISTIKEEYGDEHISDKQRTQKVGNRLTHFK